MPFIEKVRRFVIDECGVAGLVNPKPGDLCYPYYRDMVRQWRAKPCWTTAHNIYKELLATIGDKSTDEAAAYSLAWQVFFQFYVIPYEREAEKRNGTI